MTFNPYAPPQSPLDPAVPGGAGAPQPWSIEEVLRAAWEVTKIQWPVLVFGPIVANLVAAVPGQLLPFIVGRTNDEVVTAGVQIASISWGWIAGVFFQGGLIQLFISAARGQSAQFGDVFAGGSVFLRLLAANFLMTLAIMIGFVLLIVPGIILALGLSMTPYYVVEGGMGPVEAMRASWESMKGNKGQMFVFGIASMGVSLVGLLACCVGVLVAYAVIQTATAMIYLRVSGRGGWGAPPPSPYA